MGFFDKLKENASNLADKAKKAADDAKANYEEKKAAEQQHKVEMEELSKQKAEEIISAIKSYQNSGGFFQSTTKQELLDFTKDFYDKIFMPANSVKYSKIQMHPYIDDKQIGKFKQIWNEYNECETAIIHLKAEKREIVITYETLYFSISLDEDPKFLSEEAYLAVKSADFQLKKMIMFFLSNAMSLNLLPLWLTNRSRKTS